MLNRFLIVALAGGLLGAGLDASTYRGRDGSFKTASYTVKVHWADIWNVRPRRRHWVRSRVTLMPGKGWQKPKSCTLIVGKKKLKMAAGSISIAGMHVRSFRIRCLLRSSVNKSITQIDRRFKVTQKPRKGGSPFIWPLVVTAEK